MEHHLNTHVTIGICMYLDCYQNHLKHLNINIKITSWYSGHEYVLKFIGANHCISVEIACCCDKSWKDIVSNIIKSLLSLFISIHVERIGKLSNKYSSTACLNSVYRRIQIFNLSFS